MTTGPKKKHRLIAYLALASFALLGSSAAMAQTDECATPVALPDGTQFKAIRGGRGPALAKGATVKLACSPADVIVLKD